jgi:outer membrane protein
MKRLITLSTVVFIFLNASAQESAHEFSVKQCIEYAFNNQSQVLNSVLDQEMARAKVKEITGIGLPQINSSFEITDYLERPTQLVPFGPRGELVPIQFGTKYNGTASVTASQLLFDGTYLVGLQTSMVYLGLAQKAVERSRMETAVAVSKAYYTALINEERIKFLNDNLAQVKKLVDDTRAMNESGFVEKIDLDRAMLNYNNLVVEVQNTEKLLGLSYFLLKFQMGMDVNAPLKLTDKLSDSDLESSVSVSDGKFDYTRRIEYSLLQTQEKMSQLQLRKDKLAYLPSLVAFGNLSTQAQRNVFNFGASDAGWYAFGLVGARITLPIFDGLQREARIRQSRYSLQKVQNDLKTLSRVIELELKSSQINYQNSVQRLSTQKKTVDLATEVYRVAKIKYDEGVGNNIEVILAETSLREARTNYYTALYEAYVAKVELNKANGTINY